MRTGKGRDYIREIVKETRSAQALANFEQGRCNQGGEAGLRGILLPPWGSRATLWASPGPSINSTQKPALFVFPLLLMVCAQCLGYRVKQLEPFILTLSLMGNILRGIQPGRCY